MLALAISFFCQSCIQNKTQANNGDDKTQAESKLNKYKLTIVGDKFDDSAKKFIPADSVDSIRAENDTVAYLTALKTFYNQKIEERKKFNFGQPKSFSIVDTKGIDLTIKLSDKVVNGLKNQVMSQPDVQQMLEAYQRDSTATN